MIVEALPLLSASTDRKIEISSGLASRTSMREFDREFAVLDHRFWEPGCHLCPKYFSSPMFPWSGNWLRGLDFDEHWHAYADCSPSWRFGRSSGALSISKDFPNLFWRESESFNQVCSGPIQHPVGTAAPGKGFSPEIDRSTLARVLCG
jgi:hypothetical protein